MRYEHIVELLVTGFDGYVAAGIVFAIAFVTRGVGRIDEQARGTSWAFRIIIIPGAIALWPLLLKRWLRTAGTSGEAK